MIVVLFFRVLFVWIKERDFIRYVIHGKQTGHARSKYTKIVIMGGEENKLGGCEWCLRDTHTHPSNYYFCSLLDSSEIIIKVLIMIFFACLTFVGKHNLVNRILIKKVKWIDSMAACSIIMILLKKFHLFIYNVSKWNWDKHRYWGWGCGCAYGC